METDRHKFLDKAEPENEPAGICSFSWGNRELRIFGEQSYYKKVEYGRMK